MLTLTETASHVVKTIVERDPKVTEGGLRIAANPDTDQQFQIAVVAAPEPSDAVIEDAGARVFLEDSTTAVLDDKTLDATVSDTGAVTFALVPQL